MPRVARKRRRVRGEGPPKILALLAACPLYPEPSENACGACGRELVGRRTRWCSTACARSWRLNHIWTYARRAARARDKQTCQGCGVVRPPRPSRRRFASDVAYEAARATYEAVRLEVNHRVPLSGALRSAAGCHHHAENLETLCVACHKPVTAAQAAERAARRRALKNAAAFMEAA